MSDEEALRIVLNRIKDVVLDEWGGNFNCPTCGDLIYDLDEGDYLECVVLKAFEHNCD